MRALIITDADTAAREGVMLSRLEIGLISQSVRILYAEPSDDQLHLDAESLITGLTYISGGSILTLKARARQLVRQIDEAIGFDDPTTSRLDVVHAIGSGAWNMALHTAAASGAHLAIEVTCAKDLARVPSFENRAARALADEARLAWIAPGASVSETLRTTSRKAMVLNAFWGAHASESRRTTAQETRTPAIAVLTGGHQTARLVPLLDAIKQYQPAESDRLPMVFLDEHAISRTHNAAKHIRRLGLNDRLSIVPSLEHSRSLTLCCDLLILPDADGQHRSIILDAMAHGVLVLAGKDPLLADLLRHSQTALLTDSIESQEWLTLLQTAFSDDPQLDVIRARARDLVRGERTASAQVDAIAAIYDRLCGEPSIPFAASTK